MGQKFLLYGADESDEGTSDRFTLDITSEPLPISVILRKLLIQFSVGYQDLSEWLFGWFGIYLTDHQQATEAYDHSSGDFADLFNVATDNVEGGHFAVSDSYNFIPFFCAKQTASTIIVELYPNMFMPHNRRLRVHATVHSMDGSTFTGGPDGWLLNIAELEVKP